MLRSRHKGGRLGGALLLAAVLIAALASTAAGKPEAKTIRVAIVGNPHLVYDAQINAVTGSRYRQRHERSPDPVGHEPGLADHIPGGLHLHRAGPAGVRGRQQRERSRGGHPKKNNDNDDK